MRLMKLRRTYLYFVSAAFILLAGCESDYENRYPFDNAAYIDVAETSSDNNVTFKKTVTQLDRELSAVLISPAKENIEVTFGIDPSLAATYNAKHDTKYAVLDESYYEFPERTATVEAGKSVSEPLTIHFKNLDQLDIDAYEAIVRVHDFHYAGPTSSYIEEKLSTIMGVEQHLLLRIGDTNFYADQLQVDGSGVSLGKFPEKNKGKLLSLEEWYHVAFTYDLETGIACIYVNGQLQSQTQVAPTVKVINLGLRAIDPDPETDARQFFIGYSYDAFRQLCGDISEVRIWSVARTQADIWRDMYDVENPAEKPELRAYWKFNEGSGNIIKDWSQYGNDAVAHTDLKWNTSVEIPQLNKQE